MQKIKNFFVNAVLMFFGFGAALLLLELFIRLFYPMPKSFYDFNPYFGWFHKPNEHGWRTDPLHHEFKIFAKTNSKGLHDNEYAYEKPDGVFRILVLGDSYMDAMEVPFEKNFTSLLEQQLNKEDKKKFEVINGGVSGYGTDNELLFYEHEGRKYHPDLVLCAYFYDLKNNTVELDRASWGGNDPHKPYYTLDKNKKLARHSFPLKKPVKPKQMGDTVLRRVKDILSASHLYQESSLLLRVHYPAMANVLILKGLMTANPTQPLSGGVPFDYLIYTKNYPESFRKAWELTEALFVRMKKEVEKDRAKFLLLMLPSPDYVHEELLAEIMKRYPEMKKIKWDFSVPNQLMKAFAKKENITLLDLYPFFKQEAEKTKSLLFYRYEKHWNEKGNAVAARAVTSYILKQYF